MIMLCYNYLYWSFVWFSSGLPCLNLINLAYLVKFNLIKLDVKT
jgi:hypothetical protein